MELTERVTLNLSVNDMWAEWAEALSKMELKKWVTLDLWYNNIWDDWAQAILDNMKLKEWVTLDLSQNSIWDTMKEKFKEWEKSYHDKWINCEVKV